VQSVVLCALQQSGGTTGSNATTLHMYHLPPGHKQFVSHLTNIGNGTINTYNSSTQIKKQTHPPPSKKALSNTHHDARIIWKTR
jgi:hypothetical protein